MFKTDENFPLTSLILTKRLLFAEPKETPVADPGLLCSHWGGVGPLALASDTGSGSCFQYICPSFLLLRLYQGLEWIASKIKR